MSRRTSVVTRASGPTRNASDAAEASKAAALATLMRQHPGAEEHARAALGHAMAGRHDDAEDHHRLAAGQHLAAQDDETSGSGRRLHGKAAHLHMQAAALHAVARAEPDEEDDGDDGNGVRNLASASRAVEEDLRLLAAEARARAERELVLNDEGPDLLEIPPTFEPPTANQRRRAGDPYIENRLRDDLEMLDGPGLAGNAGGTPSFAYPGSGAGSGPYPSDRYADDAPPRITPEDLVGRGMEIDELTRENRRRQGLPEDSEDDDAYRQYLHSATDLLPDGPTLAEMLADEARRGAAPGAPARNARGARQAAAEDDLLDVYSEPW